MWEAKVMQCDEQGIETCLATFYKVDADMAEDRACRYINDRDLDNQFPESEFFVTVRRRS